MSDAKTSAKTFVDLYSLLGLKPLEDDNEKIQNALRECVRTAKSAKASGDAKAAKRAAKLLELGKQNLLNEQRKQAYDLKWKSAQTAEQGDLDWDWQELEGFLPEGDPSSDFDLANFIETSEPLPDLESQADYRQLLSILGVEVEEETQGTNVEVAAAVPLTQVLASEELGENAESSEPATAQIVAQPVTSATVQAVVPAAAEKPSSRSLARSLRKKRDRSLMLASLGLLGGVAILLGIVLAVLNLTGGDGKEKTIIAQASEPDPAGTGGGGLGGGGLADNGVGGGFGASNTAQAPIQGSGLPAAGSGLPPVASGGGSMDNSMGAEPMQPSVPPMNSGSDSMQPEPPPADPVPPAETEPMQPSQPQLTQAEKEAWKAKMLEIRKLLSSNDYKSAEQKLQEASDLAKVAEQESQFIRLKTAAAHARQGYDALLRAMANLEGGSSFKVGSVEVAFVEGGPERLVVRLPGQNKRYPLGMIPVGLVKGLLDLELDLKNGDGKASRAAFILFHPAANELSLPFAKRMMEEAEEQDAVPKQTSLVFEDTYEL